MSFRKKGFGELTVNRSFSRVVFSTFTVIALGMMGRPVAASDVDDMAAGGRALPVAPVHNWSGCYLGGYVGGVTESREVNAWNPSSSGGTIPAHTFYDPIGTKLPPNPYDVGEFNYDLNPSVIGGGTLGCNWQGAASPFVFGVEGEAGYMKISASAVSRYSEVVGTNTVTSTTIGDWDALITGRFGAAWDRILVYFKGGVGFTDIKSSIINNCATGPCTFGPLTATGGSTQPFWVAGIGVEYAFSRNWSVKGEFLNLGMYKKYDVCGPGSGPAAGATFCGMHSIEGLRTYKLGVNYYFDTAIAAKQ
jgi:outer membrane immunogenic protein